MRYIGIKPFANCITPGKLYDEISPGCVYDDNGYNLAASPLVKCGVVKEYWSVKDYLKLL